MSKPDLMPSEQELIFWAKEGFNVLFEGKHGVGKTSIVLSVFNKLGLKYKYFSAATIDPWVDLIGIPKETGSENSKFLDFVRPKDFALDEVEAIFLDEYNRSHKKVRNAVMELIQFKSINGHKFKNLKIVWAAINPPSEGEYDVENLDPAQKDRFHIHVQTPYEPDLVYFSNKFGENGKVAVEWWGNLSQSLKNLVSPRRLDYALDVFEKGGDIRYVLDISTNPSKLASMLSSGSVIEQMEKIYKKKDATLGKKFIRIENNYNHCLDVIKKNKGLFKFYIPLMDKEKVASLINENDESQTNSILDLCKSETAVVDIVKNLIKIDNKTSGVLRNKIKKNNELFDLFHSKLDKTNWGTKPVKPAMLVISKNSNPIFTIINSAVDKINSDEPIHTPEKLDWIDKLSVNMVDIALHPEYLSKITSILVAVFSRCTVATLEENAQAGFRIINSIIEQKAKIDGCSNEQALDDLLKTDLKFVIHRFNDSGLMKMVSK